MNVKREDEKDIRKKLAEQLSSRAEMKPQEIEEGVETFLRRSTDSIRVTDVKPPYRRPIWYDKFFRIIQQRSVARFTLDFITLNITSVKSEAYKFLNGLRFLHLSDENGIPTPMLDDLHVTGKVFTKNLEQVITKAYADLFETVHVQSADPESLVNYMIGRHGYSKPLAEDATSLFLYFCRIAEIPVSPELESFKPSREKEVKIGIGRRSSSASKNAPRREREPSINRSDENTATINSDDYSFSVRMDLDAIDFAQQQFLAWIDYLRAQIRAKRQSSI